MPEGKGKTGVLFVCMGNICRSPTAEGVFRNLVQAKSFGPLRIDSAGTHAYHIAETPDSRAQTAALARGVDLSSQNARAVRDQDYFDFNYILAMDQDNLRVLQRRRPENGTATLRLFLDFAQSSERDVPDPYYGGLNGFERVLDLVEDASIGLLTYLKRDSLRRQRG
jgi:protein-tyrosine phosphatase